MSWHYWKHAESALSNLLSCVQATQKGVVIQIITTVSLDSHSHASQTIDASDMVL